MSRCRATSFYVAPGKLRYFAQHTLAVVHDGELFLCTHRDDVHAFAAANPDWDGIVLVGPRGGLDALRARVGAGGGDVEIWRVDPRVVEGRRPRDAATHVMHKWAVTGDLNRVGGARQLADTVAPTAPRSVRRALVAAAERGEMLPVEVVGAAWRAGLLTNPDHAVRLLAKNRFPVAVVPDARLEPLLAALTAAGHDLDPVAFCESLLDVRIDAGAKHLLASDPSVPPEVLTLLAGDDDAEVRVAVARNPSAPPEALTLLAGDPDEWARRAVAVNPSVLPEVLTMLAGDPDEEVRRGVAWNPSAPSELLTLLAGDQAGRVRRGVAGNPSAPPELLTLLAGDQDMDVRHRVAGNPSAPPEALTMLAGDQDWEVREGVAANPSAPPELLTMLAGDDDTWVRGSVAGNRAVPPEALTMLAGDDNRLVRRRVASNPSVPPEALTMLAGDKDWEVRQRLAENQSAPQEVLTMLAGDDDTWVRGGVAGNRAVPPEVLTLLAGDKDWEVRRAVAENPSVSPELLTMLAGDQGWAVRRGVADNRAVPLEVLTMLAGGQDWSVRDAALRNPGCPFAVVAASGHDDIYHARALIERRPLSNGTTTDLVYSALVAVGAPAPDTPGTVTAAHQLGSRNIPFAFPDDTLELRRTLHTSDVTVGDRKFRPRVLSSAMQIDENANYMGNCTAGYTDDIRSDRTLIVALDDEHGTTRFNVEVLRGPGGRWDGIGEINSRFNKGVTAAERDAIHNQVHHVFETLNA